MFKSFTNFEQLTMCNLGTFHFCRVEVRALFLPFLSKIAGYCLLFIHLKLNRKKIPRPDIDNSHSIIIERKKKGIPRRNKKNNNCINKSAISSLTRVSEWLTNVIKSVEPMTNWPKMRWILTARQPLTHRQAHVSDALFLSFHSDEYMHAFTYMQHTRAKSTAALTLPFISPPNLLFFTPARL